MNEIQPNTLQVQTSKENTANNKNHRRQNALTYAQSQYVVAAQRALQKYMLRHFARASMIYFDPYELASYATEKIMSQLGRYMLRYPDPIAAAHAVARNAAWDHLRRVRAQRGEGARGERPVVGLQSRVNAGDEDSPTWEDMLESTFDRPEDVAERIDAEREIAEALDEFSAVGLDGALADEVHGRTQGDVARQHGVARETVNRATKRGQQRARAKREETARRRGAQVKAARARHALKKKGGK